MTVDSIDYEFLVQWNWYAVHCKPDRWYAQRQVMKNWKKRTIHAHKLVLERMGLNPYPECDHKDHDGLNNERSNLRPCSRSQNSANKKKWPGRTSVYKGVSFQKATQKWMSQINFNRKCYFLGYFNSEYQAHLAYVEAADILHGEFMCAG